MATKKILALAVMTLISTAALAKDGNMYFKAFAGYGGTTHKGAETDPDFTYTSSVKGRGLAYGASLGVKWNNFFRTDLEYYGNDGMKDKKSINVGGVSSATTVSATVNGAFVNAGLEFANKSMFTPYVFGGMGLAYVSPKIKINNQNIAMNSKSVTAYQAGAGVMVALTKAVNLDLGARRVEYSSNKIKAKNSQDALVYKKGADTLATAGVVIAF